MSGNRWSVAIVGCGRIAGRTDHPETHGRVETHAQAFHRHPAFTLCAAADPDPAALKRFQESWGVPHGYPSLDRLLEAESPDVIDLCSPADRHFIQVEAILQSDRRPRLLFVEKPVCREEGELRRLVGLAKEQRVPILVNHTRRFDAAHRRVARWIQEGRWGRLIEGRCTTFGGWQNNGTHWVDTLRMLFDEELQLLSASRSGVGRMEDPDLNVRLQVGGGVVELVAFDERHYKLFEGDLRFEAGRVQFLEAGAQIRVERQEMNRWQERVLNPEPDSPLRGLADPLLAAAGWIEDLLRNARPVQEGGASLDSAARTMRTVWQAQAMASGTLTEVVR